ncbi:MAG: OadG family protein [Firmicutes bacterium]|nr:OadG family protein [Candidatus Fiminaster equi]
MVTLGIWQNFENMTVVDALLVALICIVIVFFILVLLIFITWLINLGIDKVVASTSILPKEENKILEEDKDAVVAVLAATIDFNKETGKNAEVISVTRIED